MNCLFKSGLVGQFSSDAKLSPNEKEVDLSIAKELVKTDENIAKIKKEKSVSILSYWREFTFGSIGKSHVCGAVNFLSNLHFRANNSSFLFKLFKQS
jgi:hypothetical protein